MKQELKQQAMEASPLAGTVPPRRKSRIRETTLAGKVGSWQRLIATLDANAGEIPHLQALRDRLEAMVGQVADLKKQQAARRASRRTGRG
jgi:hypothetical protein